MDTQSFSNTPGYVLILIGLVLSLLTALVPHFDAGYSLLVSVFAAGVLPYLAYSVAAVLMPGTLTTLAGVIIVAVHTWLAITERIIGGGDYSNGVIYLIPVIIALLTLPLAATALRKQAKYLQQR